MMKGVTSETGFVYCPLNSNRKDHFAQELLTLFAVLGIVVIVNASNAPMNQLPAANYLLALQLSCRQGGKACTQVH